MWTERSHSADDLFLSPPPKESLHSFVFRARVQRNFVLHQETVYILTTITNGLILGMRSTTGGILDVVLPDGDIKTRGLAQSSTQREKKKRAASYCGVLCARILDTP